jgi:hypothetical protein
VDNETGTVVCTVSFDPSGIKNSNPDPEMSGPTIEDCNNYEIYGEGRIYRMTGNELHSLIKESVKKVVKESLYGDYSRYAFNNAKNLKDFDRLRHSAEIEGEDEAELALTNHPQSNSNFYSHEYANGNLGLDDLEDDAKLSKEMYGI